MLSLMSFLFSSLSVLLVFSRLPIVGKIEFLFLNPVVFPDFDCKFFS